VDYGFDIPTGSQIPSFYEKKTMNLEMMDEDFRKKVCERLRPTSSAKLIPCMLSLIINEGL